MAPREGDYESNLPTNINWKLMNTTTLVLNTNAVLSIPRGKASDGLHDSVTHIEFEKRG